MRIVAEGLAFPEGPIWLPNGSLLLVEIARETLTRITPDGRVSVVATIAGGPNGAAVGPDGQIFVCNNGGFNWARDGLGPASAWDVAILSGRLIEVVDPQNGAVRRLYDSCNGRRLNGPNDIVFDSDGFWFTDLGKRRDREMDSGFVYWAKADDSEIRQVIGPIMTTNGIGLSTDGRALSVAETEGARLWAWEIVSPGELRHLPWPSPNGGRLAGSVGGMVRFGSLAVTESGAVCVAGLIEGGIYEVFPGEGRFRRHPLPDLLPANLCFGGPDRRTVFVTLSHGGRVIALDWHEPGLALSY